jgi:cold shock CspA family protein
MASETERVMQGQITKFHDTIGFGVIRAADGRKYRFSKSDIRNPNGRLVGLDVDFLVESRSPKDIILLHGSPWRVFAQAHSAKTRS